MDKSLFEKYSQQITKRVETQEEIQDIIKREVGVTLEKNEFTLTKKVLTFQISSVKRTMFRKLNIEEVLKKHGYSVKQ